MRIDLPEDLAKCNAEALRAAQDQVSAAQTLVNVELRRRGLYAMTPTERVPRWAEAVEKLVETRRRPLGKGSILIALIFTLALAAPMLLSAGKTLIDRYEAEKRALEQPSAAPAE